MENALTYILQVNLLLGLIYLGYYVLLKGLTFYQLNRAYFVIGTLYAFVYPFLDIKDWFTNSKILTTPVGEILYYLPMQLNKVDNSFSVNDLMLILVGVGAFILFNKLAIQLFSLWRIHKHSTPAKWKSYLFRDVFFPIVPFSFFNKIYIHQEQH